MSDSFVHLHLHTEYSLLDGAVRIDELMDHVKRHNMPAVAITDHGNIYGSVPFFQKAQAAGVKPIFGCEMYLATGSMHEKKEVAGRKRNSHLTVLAKNETGYANLVKLVSLAHLEGVWYKPRVDKEALAKYSEGLVVLSGCVAGEVNQFIINDQLDLARQSITEFVDIFGKDDFYLEVHDHGFESQQKCTRQMVEFSKEFDLKLVAANDVHFLNEADHEGHDIMICIGTGSHEYDENRMRYPTDVYFKSAQEMRELFKEIPEACDHTLEIAEKCDVTLKLDATSTEKYPEFDAPTLEKPREKSLEERSIARTDYFRKLCYQGLVNRYGEERANSDEELIKRLEYELGIIEQMGFSSYFLITWDFIKWARDNKIPVGPGRGSAAGSLVAYVTEITDLCPLQFGLIFERFLNPERVSPPDVDIDFCQSRRPEVIEYVRQKYGERCVSHILTFGTMGAKSVVRDVGRVLGMSYGDTDRIAKMIPNDLKMNLNKAKEMNPELAAAIENEPKVRQLWRYATYLEGLTRGTGVHAAGVVIGDRPLDDFIALTRSNEGDVVSQHDMGALTELGMLKMDFLGLKTLTVIQDAENHVYEEFPDFDVNAVPLDDKSTLELISRGETIGVFQLESGGMANLCRQMKPDRIEDIIALIALYRPGPMDLIPSYIARKHGKEAIVYEHALLEDVSKETYGILIYQEQVQKAANLLAGYTLGGADMLRRAMGKKKVEEMDRQRRIFVEGCEKVNSIPAKKANAIFDLLEKFAGYGFNKSHSAAYGLITYRTAYLKANFPVEFMCGLLSNEINNTDKIAIFVSEARDRDIKIFPPNINKSQLKFAPERIGDVPQNGRHGATMGIRFGVAAIKNVGEGAMEHVLAVRKKGGEFKTMEDFASRVDSKTVNRKIMESLIKAGAFDWVGEDRASLFARLPQIIASSQAATRDRQSGQGSLFGDDELVSIAPTPAEATEPAPEWTQEDMLNHEKDLLGFYVTGHPLDPYQATIKARKKIRKLLDLDKLQAKEGGWGRKKEPQQLYKFAGFIAELAVKYTKKDNKPFAIMKLEDFDTSVEVMVWNDTWTKLDPTRIEVGAVVLLTAEVEIDDRSDQRRLTANDLKILEVDPEAPALPVAAVPEAPTPVSAVPDPTVSPLVLHFQAGSTSEDLRFVHSTIVENGGRTPVLLVMVTQGGERIQIEPSQRFSVNRQQVADKLAKWIA